MKSNFIKITLAQLLVILTPFTVNIYLAKTISVEVYGTFIFYQSIFAFLSILISTGLANDSLRDMSSISGIGSNFAQKLNNLVAAKIFYLICSIAFCLLLSLFSKFHTELFYSLFLYLVYYFLDFSIVYQAINRISIHLFIALISYLITVVGLLWFIKLPTDIIYVSSVATIPSIFLNFLFINRIYKNNSFCFSIDFRMVLSKVKSNFKIMFSSIVSAFVTRGIYLMIGLTLDMKAVAIYSLLDQIVRMPLVFINKYSSLFTPKIVEEIESNQQLNVNNYFSKIFIFILAISLAIALLMFGLSDIFLNFLFKNDLNETISHLYEIMLLQIPVIALSSLCALQYHLNVHRDDLILKYSLFLLFLGAPFIVASMMLFGLYGLTVGYVFVEILVLSYFYAHLKFNPLIFFIKKYM